MPDASGLFNLMRNLGGAIGIALIDTILYGRTGGHAEALRDRLIAGDVTAAQAIGLDLQLFPHRPPDVSDATVEAYVRPMVEKAAFARQHQRSLGPARLRGADRPAADAVRGTAAAACADRLLGDGANEPNAISTPNPSTTARSPPAPSS